MTRSQIFNLLKIFIELKQAQCEDAYYNFAECYHKKGKKSV